MRERVRFELECSNRAVGLLPFLTATRRSLACARFGVSLAQLKRSSFLATVTRLEGLAPGDEHLAAPKPIGRKRTFDVAMEKQLVEMCMQLKEQYFKIDDSHIIVCAAQVICESSMTREEKLAAYTRVRRSARCVSV